MTSSKSFKKHELDPVKGNVNENSVTEREINLSEGRDIMKTLKGCVGFGALVVAITAMPSTAEVDASLSTVIKQNSSEVHRVGTALANKESYRSSQSGYKWGKARRAPSQGTTWVADSIDMPTSYKWSEQQEGGPLSGDYAGSAGYDWKTMGEPAQSGYRWRAQNTPEVAGYRWRAQ